ncbi:hypothetical protein PRUPE_3G225000 [Prunus persica]|uniref:Uncharacterized protein n=1 Tax=Prunus persica TaxID=3760 RepID=A0A251Q467_PRUPE|nr:hypothetical protein PRUPE_3G225000 [Prunus persica]
MAIQEMIFHNNTNNYSLTTLEMHKLRSYTSDNELLRQDFPLSKRTACTEAEVVVEVKCVDQTGVLAPLKRTKLPYLIFNTDENLSEIGFSLFATQTMVLADTTRPEYQVPM